MWEATINYVKIDETGTDRNVKEQYVCENNESFSDVEEMLWQMFGTFTGFEVSAIKRSKIKEVANSSNSDEDLIWMAEMQDVFHDDEGNEKYTKYRIVFYAKTYEGANAFIQEYSKQGYDMSLVSLKLTKFDGVL